MLEYLLPPVAVASVVAKRCEQDCKGYRVRTLTS